MALQCCTLQTRSIARHCTWKLNRSDEREGSRVRLRDVLLAEAHDTVRFQSKLGRRIRFKARGEQGTSRKFLMESVLARSHWHQDKREAGMQKQGESPSSCCINSAETRAESCGDCCSDIPERRGIGFVTTTAASVVFSFLLPLFPIHYPSPGPQPQQSEAQELEGRQRYTIAKTESPFEFLVRPQAKASGLLLMPPLELKNNYFLVRAGESEYESQGILHTNPVDKTSMTSGLSEQGKKEAVAAGIKLEREGACSGSCWIWSSISQRAYQTAEVIAYVNGLSYSNIVPEYSFLDARGVGAYENSPLEVMEELYGMDSENERLRPPPYYDGTPSESVQDVFVRVRQMMSILETQYSGDTIIVVSPDSDNLSVLQAAVTGLELKSHHLLKFSPGEVRHLELPKDVAREPLVSGVVKI